MGLEVSKGLVVGEQRERHTSITLFTMQVTWASLEDADDNLRGVLLIPRYPRRTNDFLYVQFFAFSKLKIHTKRKANIARCEGSSLNLHGAVSHRRSSVAFPFRRFMRYLWLTGPLTKRCRLP